MDNSQITVISGMAIQFLTGFITNKLGAPAVRKLIPIPILILSFLTQIVAGFQNAAGSVPTAAVHAGFFVTFGKGFLDILLNSLIQTLVVVGAHSAPKNVQEGIRMASVAKN